MMFVFHVGVVQIAALSALGAVLAPKPSLEGGSSDDDGAARTTSVAGDSSTGGTGTVFVPPLPSLTFVLPNVDNVDDDNDDSSSAPTTRRLVLYSATAKFRTDGALSIQGTGGIDCCYGDDAPQSLVRLGSDTTYVLDMA